MLIVEQIFHNNLAATLTQFNYKKYYVVKMSDQKTNVFDLKSHKLCRGTPETNLMVEKDSII